MDGSSSALLAPLTPDQQSLVDAIADAFEISGYEWPFFDYLEGVFDDRGKDAWAILQSFPELGRWRYGAVVWQQSGGAKPAAESEVALSIIGMSHAPSLRQYVNVFFSLVDFLAGCQREISPQPREVRNLTVTSSDFDEWWRSGRRLGLSPRLVWQLKEHEPPTRVGGGSLQPDGSWSVSVSRLVLSYAGLSSIEDYAARLEDYLIEPAAPLQPLLASPLSLAAALDYLDVVWRLTHERARLFEFPSAERTTRLSFDLQTADEFAGHLTALADILREANKGVHTTPARKDRNRPLGRIEADITKLVEDTAAPRVAGAIAILELVVSLRDAGQHSAAGERAVEGFRELGLPYPPNDWSLAWQTVSARTVSALNTLREELESAAL